MNRKGFVSIIIIVSIFVSCLTGTFALGQTISGGGMKPLRQEMLALEEAFEAIIDALLFDNMELIKPTIPPLLKAKERVEKAINEGEQIVLPKNQDRFDEFIKFDDRFHKDFDALLKAAEKGNKKVAKGKTHKLFDACVSCHENFRK